MRVVELGGAVAGGVIGSVLGSLFGDKRSKTTGDNIANDACCVERFVIDRVLLSFDVRQQTQKKRRENPLVRLNDVVVIAVPYREIVPVKGSHDMSSHNAAAGIKYYPIRGSMPLPPISDEPEIVDERLPFTIRVVQNNEDLSKAVNIRQAAYARHLPKLAQSGCAKRRFRERCRRLAGGVKLDGSPLGTARIQTNHYRPLAVEQSVNLPDWLQGRRLAEVTRLGVGGGRVGYLVKIVLIKASFEYCEQNGIDWAVVAGRAPIDRQYEQLLFQDVFPGKGFIPMRHAGDIPHRVMAFEIKSGQERWSTAKHPLLKFFRYTRHADIDISCRGTNLDDGILITRQFSETTRLM